MFYLYLCVHICSYLFHVQCAVCDEVRGELLGGHESGQSQSSNHSSLAASSSILERMIFCTGGQLSHHQSSVCIWCLHFGLKGMCLEEIALFDLTFALLYLARFIHKPRCFWLISGFGMIWGADNEILRLFCFFCPIFLFTACSVTHWGPGLASLISVRWVQQNWHHKARIGPETWRISVMKNVKVKLIKKHNNENNIMVKVMSCRCTWRKALALSTFCFPFSFLSVSSDCP